MLLNSREFKFLKNYRNEYGKSSAKREYRDENVFLKVDRAFFFSILNTPRICSIRAYSVVGILLRFNPYEGIIL